MQKNISENVVCEMASILSRPQCVKTVHLLLYTGFIDTVDKTLFYQFLRDAETILEQFQFSQTLSVTFNDYILISLSVICPALEI